MTSLHFDTSTPSSEFEIIKEIGKGGYGIVVEVLHKPSGKRFAGKIIDPQFVENENDKALQSEISVLKETSSEYTINYYGTIKLNDRLCILMDLCDRGSLRDIIDYRNEVLTEEQIAFVMHDLLMALKILHKKQIIHRDIKAANILVTSKGEIKVTDFGVSRQFDATAKTLSTMSIIGTPYWMAPEVIEGRKYSFPADIWSVGTTAVELAEGGPPYCEFPPTRAMVEISTRGFPGFRYGNVLSSDFQDFVCHCMVVDPSKRATPDQLLQHPFIKQIEKLDREQVFHDLVKDEIDFTKLLNNEYEYEEEEDEYSDEIDLGPSGGNTVEVTKQKPDQTGKVTKVHTKTKEVKRGYETFISKCAPGAVVEDLYQTKAVGGVDLPPPPANQPQTPQEDAPVTYYAPKPIKPPAPSEQAPKPPPQTNQNNDEPKSTPKNKEESSGSSSQAKGSCCTIA